MSRRYQSAILTASYNGLQVPNAPTIGTATAGSGSASVTFTAPSNVGGSAITSYTVISSPGGITGTGASSPVTVSGLTNGTAYTFTVVATNAYGSGPASAASNSVTPTVNYIENVFSTWLYTGNGSTQTITNGIDLSGNGGLVWFKNRNSTNNHALYDTARGATKRLSSSQTGGTGAQVTDPTSLTAFNSNGFSIGSDNSQNENTFTFASWTFREQPKFFDVVTYTGNNATGIQNIAHNLGSVPGCIIIKCFDVPGYDWVVYHRSTGASQYTALNTTAAASATSTFFNATAPTSTQFTVGTSGSTNGQDQNYVAYVFAHDAGGFGLSGTDNVISCGSYTGNGSNGQSVSIGYEPQWLLIKRTDTTANWQLQDNMRPFSVTATEWLNPNTSNAESTGGVAYVSPTATGFTFTSGGASVYNANGGTYIYIAIRRGPMAVPTLGTSVFSLDASSAGGSGGLLGAITASDLVINSQRDPAANSPFVFIDRLRGVGQVNTGATTKALYSSNTNAETTVDTTSSSSTAEGVNGAYLYSAAGKSSAIRTVQQGPGGSVAYNLIRAPGFFDEVCYTGNGSTQTITHNLGVTPELIIAKNRGQAGNNWPVLFNFTPTTCGYGFLNTTTAENNQTYAYVGALASAPTATTFSLINSSSMNASGYGIVAYLFATCPGVSKVGLYTGTGALQTVNCGFTAGARFVFIKRADSAGDWYVWDSARGITSGNDPYLLLNSTAAEVTGTNYVDSIAAGFQVTAAAPAGLNAVGGTYIFLAIA